MENQTEEPAPDAPVGDVPAPSVYAGLTVVELKEKLRERELPVSGTKNVLLARLAETETAPATADEKGPDYSKLSRRELKQHRKAINALAEELRRKRDVLNLESQSHAAERDVLNARAKELMNQVYAHRDRRNGLNVEVGETRDDLRDLSPKVDQLREDFLKIKRSRFAGNHLPPIPKLRRQIKELELKQMTSSMSIKKERALVEKIGTLQSQISEQDELLETDVEVTAARDSFRQVEQQRKDLLRSKKRAREDAQVEHESMRDALRENRKTRKRADGAQRAFVRVKELADEVHAEYIEQLRELSEIDRRLAELRRGTSQGSVFESAANAEELFRKFLSGDKLSTEQLMVIQKAGML